MPKINQNPNSLNLIDKNNISSKIPLNNNNSLNLMNNNNNNNNNNKDLSLLNENTKTIENSRDENFNIQEIIIKNKIRTDVFGNEIKLGNKKNCKVTFADQEEINKKLIDIVKIESFKKYYSMNDLGKKQKNKIVCCQCKIF